MGWPWPFGSTSPSSSSSTSNSDPFRDLDPALRSFLEKESPVKYHTPQAPPESSTALPTPDAEPDTSPAPASVPTQFPDGRYAHLWKTYTSQAALDGRYKSDQEKLTDMLGAYNERRAQIGTAAITNCALEQWAISDCLRGGSAAARLTLCRAEKREFERCYLVQSRFLRALGYLSSYDQPAEVDEAIQMHADGLYHEMLAREKVAKAAVERGEPVPAFAPLLEKASEPFTTPVPVDGRERGELPLPPAVEEMKGSTKSELVKRLRGLTGNEREMEEKAIEMEAKAAKVVAERLDEVSNRTRREREKRRKDGTATIGDRVARVFGW